MRIRIFHIIFLISIITNIFGCYTSRKVVVGKTEIFVENDKFAWVKLKSGEYYCFDKNYGRILENSVFVNGKAILFATDSLFAEREKLLSDSINQYFFNEISIDVIDIAEAEVVSFDKKKTNEVTKMGANVVVGLFSGCASAPR